jgi:hypothetical protein
MEGLAMEVLKRWFKPAPWPEAIAFGLAVGAAVFVILYFA